MNDKSKTFDLVLFNTSKFKHEYSIKSTLAFMVAISDILEVNNKVKAIPVLIILAEYLDLAKVFFENTANTLPNHYLQDLNLETTKTSLFGLLYNLSQVELEVLRRYISNHLAKSFFQLITSSIAVPIIFTKQEDESLQLYVDYWSLNLVIQKNCYFFPLIFEALHKIIGARIYTKFDIRATYNRIRVKA